jgi:hypothetical protein
MKFRYRCTPCGFKEARNERMDKTGEASNDHTHAEVGSLKQVLKVGLSYRLWMVPEEPLNQLH